MILFICIFIYSFIATIMSFIFLLKYWYDFLYFIVCDNVFFSDANAGLLNAEALPNPELLLSDGRHNNDEGYKQWGAEIKSFLLDTL